MEAGVQVHTSSSLWGVPAGYIRYPGERARQRGDGRGEEGKEERDQFQDWTGIVLETVGAGAGAAGAGAEEWRDRHRGSLGLSEAVGEDLPVNPALSGVLVLGEHTASVSGASSSHLSFQASAVSLLLHGSLHDGS